MTSFPSPAAGVLTDVTALLLRAERRQRAEREHQRDADYRKNFQAVGSTSPAATILMTSTTMNG